MGGGSGNANLCGGLTDDEQSIGQQGYFVDGLEKQFIRYVFNDTHAIETDMQPIPYIGEEGFSCSGRDWYQQGLKCTDPAKVLCPLYFQGTTGLGTFQAYGDKKESVVVAQDIATWQVRDLIEWRYDMKSFSLYAVILNVYLLFILSNSCVNVWKIYLVTLILLPLLPVYYGALALYLDGFFLSVLWLLAG